MDALPGFDPTTMTYLESQMVHPDIGGGLDPYQELMLPMEMQDHQSTYGYAGYVYGEAHFVQAE